jgi:predicted dehydrogenase
MKLGAAVIGLGVGEAHARAYAALPGCEVRWVADLDADRATRLAAELKCQSASSLAPLLADPDVHVVSIASFDDAHAEQVEASLAHGKHVFVEKPIARTLAELARIKGAWRRSDRHLSSNLILRAAPLYRQLRDMIGNGDLGEIYAIDGDYLYGRLEKITDGWRSSVEEYSVIEGGGIHLVDLMLWLTGQKPDRVSAAGNRIASRDTAFKYRDFMAATYTFPSGLIGRITANFGCVHRHHHVLRVFGTKATFLYDDRGARLHATREPASEPASFTAAPLAPTKGELIPAFVAGIREGRGDDVATQMHFDVLSACAAADRAADAGAFVEIEYV